MPAPLRLGLGGSVQVGEALLEVFAHQRVQVHEDRHRLVHEVALAVHDPGDLRPGFGRRELEGRLIRGLEGPEESPGVPLWMFR